MVSTAPSPAEHYPLAKLARCYAELARALDHEQPHPHRSRRN
ncbi:MAG: hypothetical protein ABI895_03485 [Deltaproteobacteria bacterium]